MNYKTLWIIIFVVSVLISTIFSVNFFIALAGTFVVSFVIFFIIDSYRDNQERNRGVELSEKFSTLIDVLNEWTYKGYGIVRKINNNQFSLYKEDSCQIIYFFYAADRLAITWKFKYWQQEVVYKRDLKNARNVTEEEQVRFAKLIIPEFAEVVNAHKRKIDNNSLHNFL